MAKKLRPSSKLPAPATKQSSPHASEPSTSKLPDLPEADKPESRTAGDALAALGASTPRSSSPLDEIPEFPMADTFANLVLTPDAQPASESPIPSRSSLSYEDLDIAPPADIVPGASPAPSHRSLSYEFEAPAHSPPAGFNEAPHSSPTGFDEDTFSRQESPVPSEPEHHADPDPVPQPPAPQPANTDIPIEMPPTALEILTNSSEVWFWRVLMLLCSWLHLQYHVPYRACALVLQVMQFIFITLGLLTGDSDAPITLLTTLHRLHLRDNFEIKAMCVSCHRVYNGDSDMEECSECQTPLFKSSSTTNAADTSAEPLKPPPRVNTKSSYHVFKPVFSSLHPASRVHCKTRIFP
ncbi:hypothetical protein B0H21DRAFT_826494 [Amylocystis lapponica]|nr:hypothetical protein B0H21DRAFT_826494 [Amylocystis lapponica]